MIDFEVLIELEHADAVKLLVGGTISICNLRASSIKIVHCYRVFALDRNCLSTPVS